MPRKFARASRRYAIGTHGPFSVDELARADTEALIFAATVEDWPDVPLALQVRLMWDIDPTPSVVSWSGRPLAWGGAPATSVRAWLGVPRAAGDERAIARGDIWLVVHAPLRTEITLAAHPPAAVP
jgi:hypothetical protein